MVAKKDPFDGKVPHETKNNILNSQFFKNMKIKYFCENKVEDQLVAQILLSCLSANEKNRPSCN